MNFDKAFNVAALIVMLAIIATVVASKQTASIIRSIGSSFSGAIAAAKH